MDTASQLTIIQGTQFYTDLRTQLKTINDSLAANNCQIEGTLITTVDAVVIRATPSGNGNIHVSCGQDDQGQPLYEWTAPLGWVS